MVWYYCEFCNRNVNIPSNRPPTCKDCGTFLSRFTITKEEKKIKQKERTTYCNNCNMMVFSVPIHLICDTLTKGSQLQISTILTRPKTVYFKEDRRYKSGYKMTAEGQEQCFKYCLYTFLVIITFGIALIPILYYSSKQRKKREQAAQGIYEVTQKSINTFLALQQQGFQFVCRRCYNGVKLGKKYPSDIIESEKPEAEVLICEFCGTQIKKDAKFCIGCGARFFTN